MEYFKSLESRNFRLTFTPTVEGKDPPDPNDKVTVAVYGNSEDGMRFCASKDARALVDQRECGNPLKIIKQYETTLYRARAYGMLKNADIDKTVKDRQMWTTISPAPSPAPSYKSGYFDGPASGNGPAQSNASGGNNSNASTPAASTPTAERPANPTPGSEFSKSPLERPTSAQSLQVPSVERPNLIKRTSNKI